VKELLLHAEKLKPEWCDYYGHLNEAYYLVVFSNATFALQEYFGIGHEYFKKKGCSLYTVESHISYLKEVRGDSLLQIESFIFGIDEKRLRIGHLMTVDGSKRATFECMLLHFDSSLNKLTPIDGKLIAHFKSFELEELPVWAGSSLIDIRENFSGH